MLIRPATVNDIDGVLAMRRALTLSYHPADFDAHPDWAERAASVLANMIAGPTHRIVVADSGTGAVVGCGTARLDVRLPWPGGSATTGEIADMWVDPAARGHGVARAMIDDLVAWCREQGARAVTLHSTPAATDFYERVGFHVGVPSAASERFPQMWLDF